MLYVVDKHSEMILGKWDGWYRYAESEAYDMIKSRRLRVIDEEITFMGDKIIWVE